MELNDLRIFIELYQTRSISKTSEKLSYTQSNISTRLMKLEQEFNTALFLRTKSGLEVLPGTELFYAHAKSILEEVNKLYHDFSIEKRQISIGSTQLLSRLYYPTLYPQNELFNLHTTTVNKLARNFAVHMYDIIITHTENDLFEDKDKYWKAEKLLWASSEGFKHDANQSLNIVINRDKQCPLRALTIKTIPSLHTSVSYIEVDTLDLMLTLINTSNCVALLPQGIIEEDRRLKALAHFPPMSLNIFMYCYQGLDDIVTDYFINSLNFTKE